MSTLILKEYQQLEDSIALGIVEYTIIEAILCNEKGLYLEAVQVLIDKE